jgi:DNA modification methylase
MVEITMTYQLLLGDCLKTLKTLPDCSVQCCVTSPPYYGLRDYGTAKWEGGDSECKHIKGDEKARSRQTSTIGYAESQGHNLESWGRVCGKCGAIRIDNQIGLEDTPEAYVAKLVEVFREVKRVLKDDGTFWLNLGDSYATHASGSKSHAHNFRSPEVAAENGIGTLNKPTAEKMGMKEKDLIGIPWAVAVALRADGWYLRSDIIWNKPNPMPESVTDRPTNSHEHIFLLAKSSKYYYDADAIAEPISSSQKEIDRQYSDGTKDTSWATNKKYSGGVGYNPNGMRNKRNVWTLTRKPYSGAHFATFPPDLIEPCILAGTSEKGECPKCGKAWKRVTEKETHFEGGSEKAGTLAEDIHGKWDGKQYGKNILLGPVVNTQTTGWLPQCNCVDDEDHEGPLIPVSQTVLDPFSGSGTTGAVAIEHGRNYIGCELNPDYITLSEKRIAKAEEPARPREQLNLFNQEIK